MADIFAGVIKIIENGVQFGFLSKSSLSFQYFIKVFLEKKIAMLSFKWKKQKRKTETKTKKNWPLKVYCILTTQSPQKWCGAFLFEKSISLKLFPWICLILHSHQSLNVFQSCLFNTIDLLYRSCLNQSFFSSNVTHWKYKLAITWFLWIQTNGNLAGNLVLTTELKT